MLLLCYVLLYITTVLQEEPLVLYCFTTCLCHLTQSESLGYNLFTVAAGCTVHICDFHREQCWVRWVSLSKHGVQHRRDEVLDLLRRVARAENVDDYQSHLSALQKSAVWRDSAALRQWFTRTWLPEHKVSGKHTHNSWMRICCPYSFRYKKPF